MKRTLLIQGKSFTYEEEQLSYSSTKPMDLETASALIRLVSHLFSNIGLSFYLGFGTLLGAVREKSLIKGDEDIDIFTDQQDLLYNSLPYLQENGLRLIRFVKNRVFSFKINDDGYIDVYVLCKLPIYNIWSSYCYSLDGNVTPKKYFKEYESIDFLGVNCKCPKNPEKMLAFWYGDDWRTPISGHKFYYEVKSAYYWHWLRDNLIKKVIFYNHWCKYIKKN